MLSKEQKQDLKKFLEQGNNKNLLQEKKFNELYNLCHSSLRPALTEFIQLELNIDPLKYMTFIPEHMYTTNYVGAPRGEWLVDLTIPDNVTTLHSYCMSNLPNLTTVELPKSITAIPSGAFHSDHKLSKINLINISYFGYYCFADCTSLKDKHIFLDPDLQHIEGSSFKNTGCILHMPNIKHYDIYDRKGDGDGGYTLVFPGTLEEFLVNMGGKTQSGDVTYIIEGEEDPNTGKPLVLNYTNLTDGELFKSFAYSPTFRQNLKNKNLQSMYDCCPSKIRPLLTTFLLDSLGIDPLQYLTNIPEGYITSGYNICNSDKIINLYIPHNVTSMDSNWNASVYTHNRNDITKNLFFDNNCKIEDITIKLFSQLESVVLPDQCLTITYLGCPKLKEITIPKGCTEFTVDDCSGLETLIINSTTTLSDMNSRFLQKCPNLQKIIFDGSMEDYKQFLQRNRKAGTKLSNMGNVQIEVTQPDSNGNTDVTKTKSPFQELVDKVKELLYNRYGTADFSNSNKNSQSFKYYYGSMNMEEFLKSHLTSDEMSHIKVVDDRICRINEF